MIKISEYRTIQYTTVRLCPEFTLRDQKFVKTIIILFTGTMYRSFERELPGITVSGSLRKDITVLTQQ